MSDVLVGSAHATMELRYQQFSDGVSIVEQQIKRLQQLTKTPIVAQLTGAGAGSGGAAGSRMPSQAPAIDADAAAYTRLQRAQAGLEAGQARLARGQGDTARAAQLEASAQQRLTSELQAQTGVTTQSIALERQLTTVQQQVANAAKQSKGGISEMGGALSQLKTLAGGLGIGFGLQQLVSGGIQAGGAALELRETKNSLKAVAGDLTTYNQTIGAAREQQRLFGGSLQENIEGLSGLTITARSSGAQLQSLIGLSQRLAVLDPAQGAGGARIALNEALSGDPTSLAKRYEIPRAALAKLRDTTLPVEERLKVIDSFLNKVGITAESVAGRVDQDALAFRRLGQELGDAKLNAGDQLATTFSGAATGLARLLGLINQNPQAIAELRALRGGGVVDQGAIADATRQIAGSRAAEQLGGPRGQTFAAQRIGGVENLHLAREQLTELNIAGGVSAEQADRLTQAFRNGTISGDTYRAGLAALVGEVNEGGSAEDRRAAAMGRAQTAQQAAAEAARAQTQALIDNTTKSQAAASEAEKLSTFQASLASLGGAVAAGLQTSGAAALSLAALYGIAVDKAQQLINAQALLANKPITEGRSERDTPADRAAGVTAGALAARERAAAIATARQNQLLQTGTALQKVAVLQQRYNETVAQFGKGSSQAIDAQTNLIQAQQAAGKTRVSAAATTALQLQNVEETSQLQLAKTQREGLERLRDQQADFDLKRTRGVEDFDEKRRSLLAHGQRAQAAALAKEFEKDNRRAAEDFNIQKQRTLRNNAEGTGDIGARADLRTQQIGDRAALRGVRTAGGVDLGVAPPVLTGASAQAMQPRVIILRTEIAPTSVQIDGHTIVELTWPETEQRVDTELANALSGTSAPGSGQQAVAGVG